MKMVNKRLVKPPIAAKTAVVCCDRRNAGRARGRKSRRLKRRDLGEENDDTISFNFVEYKSIEGLRYPNFMFLLLNLLFNALVG